MEKLAPSLPNRWSIFSDITGSEGIAVSSFIGRPDEPDQVLDHLVNRGTREAYFEEYDLLPLDDEVALQYLERVISFETALYDHLDSWLQIEFPQISPCSLPRRKWDLEEERDQLRRLLVIRRQSISSLFRENRPEGEGQNPHEDERETISPTMQKPVACTARSINTWKSTNKHHPRAKRPE